MRIARRHSWILLLLAALVIITCMAQRLAALQTLTVPASATASAVQVDEASPATPCELSTKSMLTALPDLPVMLLPGLLLILALLLTLTPQEQYHRARDLFLDAPPGRRRHLNLCVFRE